MTIKQRYAFFYGEFENEKKKGQKILTFWSGDLNPRFSVIFPPMIWIFMESDREEIKLKQASKRDRTFKKSARFFWPSHNIWSLKKRRQRRKNSLGFDANFFRCRVTHHPKFLGNVFSAVTFIPLTCHLKKRKKDKHET